jgi:hypothetical protein
MGVVTGFVAPWLSVRRAAPRYSASVLRKVPRLFVPIPVIAAVAVAFVACGRTVLDAPGARGGAGHATGGAGLGAAGHGGTGGLAAGGFAGFATGGGATGGFAGFQTGGFAGFQTGGFAGFQTGGFAGFQTGGFAGFSDLAGAGGSAIAGADGGTIIIGADGGVSAGCISGTNNCAGPFVAQFCVNGAFVPVPCQMGCIDGVCAECMPGTSTCASEGSVQACSATGILLPPLDCPASCLNGVCISCTDGDTRCSGDATTQQTCKAGQWTADVSCSFVCVDNMCGQSRRHVFVTSQAFVAGDLGGLPGADDICRRLAVAAGLSSSYIAWLSDDTGSPMSRFPKNVGPYVLVDGTVVANNWGELTSGMLQHPIELNEMGGPPPPRFGNVSPFAVWTDTSTSGALSQSGASCNNWSDPMGTEVLIGSSQSQDASWTEGAGEGSAGATPSVCGVSAPIYCFEQ